MDFFRGALPLEKICRFLLNEKLSKFLKRKITSDQLSLDIPSGTLTVTDIDLNPSIFNNGHKSLIYRAANIGSVQIHIAGKAAKSFFSDTVHDNLNVKVSDLCVEVDIAMDFDKDAAPKASDEEGIVAAVLAAIGASTITPVNVDDSWSELEAQMPSDSDGREQLSHIIKQFLLLAEFEISNLSVVCNVFRSGRHYHPSQFRFTVDSASLLNDFSHLKGESMPSSSVEHLTHIVFGRQLRIGKVSVDSRDSLADHCTAATFEQQQWVPIFVATLSPSSSLGGADSDPFCKLQFQLKGFESDLDIAMLKIDICIDDVKFMFDFVHIQLFLSLAKIVTSKGGAEVEHVAFACRADSEIPVKSKSVNSWFEQAGCGDDVLTVRIKSVSFLAACIDQPLRNLQRRAFDSDWLLTLQGVRFVAGPAVIHFTFDVVLFQELFNDGRRNEIIRIESNQSALRQQYGLSVKVNFDGSSNDVCISGVRLDLDLDVLHRFNTAFCHPTKSLQSLFSKSQTSSSSWCFNAASVYCEVQLSEDILQHYHAEQHSTGIIIASISQLSFVLHTDQSFEVTFDDAQLKLLPDFVIIRRLGSCPNMIKFKRESDHQHSPFFCMVCDVVLRTVDVRLSLQMRQLIFSLCTEFSSRLPHPPLDPLPLGKNFKCLFGGELDDACSQCESQSSDDEGVSRSPMGHESMLRSSIYVSAHSTFPLQDCASASQPLEPTFIPLYLILMKNALHAMGASFSGEDSFAPDFSNSVQNISEASFFPLNYRLSIQADDFVVALAGVATPPDSFPCSDTSEQPFYCSLNSSYKAKFAELDAVDSFMLLSQRLEILVSIDASASSTISQLKFGSCQIIDSYDRVHVEPFYPFDGMLPPQSVSDEDRRENGQLAVTFVSGGKCIEITITQLLLHYGHCNWVASIIRFFTEGLSENSECNDRAQKNSRDVVMTMKLKLVAFQPALLPSSLVSPCRLLIEEASVSLKPGAEEILKTISIESKALHFMVAPHVDHVLTCCNRLITGARNAHLNAVDRQNAPRHGSIATSNLDIARILRADCTLDWQRMLPLEFSASCGFLCVASIPLLHLSQKQSPYGFIVELHDIELVVFACADSLARLLAKATSDDDAVLIENPCAKIADEAINADCTDEVVLSPHSRLQLVEEEYRPSSVPSADENSYSYLRDVYGKVRASMITHWSHLTGPGKVDPSDESSTVEFRHQVDENIAPIDESFFDVSSSSIFDSSASATMNQPQFPRDEDSDLGGTSFETILESFLAWRFELVNARVSFRIFAGCDFPEYVSLEDASPPTSGAASSFRSRDMERSLELQIEGMHLRHSSYVSAAPISSRTSFKARDIKVADDVSDSFFRCLVQKDESYLECGAYERDAPVMSFTLETLQKCVSESQDYDTIPRRFEAHVLPLFCSLDERTLNAIWDLMHIFSTVSAAKESNNSGNQFDVGEFGIVYQKFILSALTFRLNYKPIMYPIMLRDSQVILPSVKLWNCPSGQVPENVLKQWGGLQEIFRQFLGGVANSVPVLSNVAHIFSALTILIQQSIQNRSSSRQTRRNIFAFLSALSGEIIDVGLIATRVADQLLSGASSVVAGAARRDHQSRAFSSSAGGARELQLFRSLQEDLKKMQQPANVQEGLQEALRSFSQGLECMMMTVLQPGRPSYIRRGAAAVLMPVQGMNRGVFQFLQGLINQLQPQRLVRHDEKYKGAAVHESNRQ